MNTKMLMRETCKGLTPFWKSLERRDRALADQGRRAMQSMVLQYAEGLHAYKKNRKMKLLGARSEAHEARVCIELASACGLADEQASESACQRTRSHRRHPVAQGAPTAEVDPEFRTRA